MMAMKTQSDAKWCDKKMMQDDAIKKWWKKRWKMMKTQSDGKREKKEKTTTSDNNKSLVPSNHQSFLVLENLLYTSFLKWATFNN